MKEFIALVIPYLVVLAQLFLFGIILFHRHKSVRPWLNQHALVIIFITSLLATVGSLFYSLIMGYTPCELCWYQRILMYPIVVMSGFSLYTKSKELQRALLFMTVVGSVIAAYHYLTQLLVTPAFCSATAVDCAARVTFSFGYISIPLMALTAFLIIFFTVLLTTPWQAHKRSPLSKK